MNERVEKSAFVAIVGKPNVGKSSLLNRLLGEKIAIVTDKPQTTRTRITGVLTKGETQLVFMDTPGFHKRKTKLSDSMNQTVKTSIQDVDVALFVAEPAGRITEAEQELLGNLKGSGLPVFLVINKIDLLSDKTKLMERISQLTGLCDFAQVIPISVKEDDGVSLVLDALLAEAQPGPHFFPDDTLTDQPERVIAAEIIREKLLRFLQQEIPHGTAVVIEKMREREAGGIVDIDAMIYCEKDSHKGMIIGKKGARLKEIATAARTDLESFLDAKVNLQCWVKVREDWRNKESMIRNFGLSQQ